MWRIKHIPTGMYYVPVRETTYKGDKVKTNLNKNGKIYHSQPTLKHISHGFNNHLNSKAEPCKVLVGYTRYESPFEPFVASDWIIEKIA